MIKTEEAIREIVIKNDWELRQKVIKEIVKRWDIEGEGFFPEYLLSKFPNYWLAKVMLN